MYALNSIHLYITRCQFTNNVAQGRGGALYFVAEPSEETVQLEIIESKFRGNKTNKGGSIYLQRGSLTITNSSFDYCNSLAGSDGGALYLHNTTVRVSKTVFSNNGAERNGGMMFVKGFQIILTVHLLGIQLAMMEECFMSTKKNYICQEFFFKTIQQTMMEEFYTRFKATQPF